MTRREAVRAGVAAALTLALAALAAGAVHAQPTTPLEPVHAGDQIRLRLHDGGTLTARLLATGPEYLRVQPTLFTGNVLKVLSQPSLRLDMAADTMVAEVRDPRITRIDFHPGAELSVPVSSVRLLEVQRGRGPAEYRRPDWAFVYGVGVPLAVLVPSAAVAGAACQCGVTGRMVGAAAATSLAIGIGATVYERFRRGPRWVPGTSAADDES
jgi:hypothetical protein